MCVSVLRRRWVCTLQEHVRDQLVFGRRRFGPGSHCQRHGVLELKGTKSKVYAAINTEQIWLYKSEQVTLFFFFSSTLFLVKFVVPAGC